MNLLGFQQLTAGDVFKRGNSPGIMAFWYQGFYFSTWAFSSFNRNCTGAVRCMRSRWFSREIWGFFFNDVGWYTTPHGVLTFYQNLSCEGSCRYTPLLVMIKMLKFLWHHAFKVLLLCVDEMLHVAKFSFFVPHKQMSSMSLLLVKICWRKLVHGQVQYSFLPNSLQNIQAKLGYALETMPLDMGNGPCNIMIPGRSHRLCNRNLIEFHSDNVLLFPLEMLSYERSVLIEWPDDQIVDSRFISKRECWNYLGAKLG